MRDDFPTNFRPGLVRDPDAADRADGTMADDAPLEPWLREIAASYNAPPAPQRDAMWERIEAAREVRHRPVPRTAWTMVALAATLALAVGVGTAGWWRDATVGAPHQAPPTVAQRTDAPTVGDDAPNSAPVEPTASTPLPTPERSRGPLATADRLARGDGLPARATAAPRPTTATTATTAAVTDARRDGGREVGAPFRLEFALHVGQAETLLTAFQADAPGPLVDHAYQPWARELLTTTRLLQDSPAGRDPVMGALLDELEPVLVQIAQFDDLPPDRMAEERQLISRSLERTDLMTQLRAALPPYVAAVARAGE